MANSEILEKLVESPNAFKIIEAAQSVLENEKVERQKFYDLTHEDCKAEFINGGNHLSFAGEVEALGHFHPTYKSTI